MKQQIFLLIICLDYCFKFFSNCIMIICFKKEISNTYYNNLPIYIVIICVITLSITSKENRRVGHIMVFLPLKLGE